MSIVNNIRITIKSIITFAPEIESNQNEEPNANINATWMR